MSNGICPICQNPKGLINGVDSKQYIEYPPDKLEQFAAGELSLTQLNEFAIIYYNRTRLCDNTGNGNIWVNDKGEPILDINGNPKFLNPPCQNYYAIRGGSLENPDVIVETLKIKDE